MPELKAGKVCSVCNEALHQVKGHIPPNIKVGEGGWIHSQEFSGGKDHVAVPVDYDEANLVAKCDFCAGTMALDERWYLDANDFQVVVVADGIGEIKHNSRSGWAACPTCAPLVAAQDWSALIERHMSTVGDVYRPEVATFIHDVMLPAMFGELEQNTTAPIRLWQAGDEMSMRED